MVKREWRRNGRFEGCKNGRLSSLTPQLQFGDIIEITWDDVRMEDDMVLSEVKPPFHFDPTTNIGKVVYCGKVLHGDWLVITSEIPHDSNEPGAVITAFPPGVMSTAKVKVLRKARNTRRCG